MLRRKNDYEWDPNKVLVRSRSASDDRLRLLTYFLLDAYLQVISKAFTGTANSQPLLLLATPRTSMFFT